MRNSHRAGDRARQHADFSAYNCDLGPGIAREINDRLDGHQLIGMAVDLRKAGIDLDDSDACAAVARSMGHGPRACKDLLEDAIRLARIAD